MLPTVSRRSEIYEGLGLGNRNYYTGTAEQNSKLLMALKQLWEQSNLDNRVTNMEVLRGSLPFSELERFTQPATGREVKSTSSTQPKTTTTSSGGSSTQSKSTPPRVGQKDTNGKIVKSTARQRDGSWRITYADNSTRVWRT